MRARAQPRLLVLCALEVVVAATLMRQRWHVVCYSD